MSDEHPMMVGAATVFVVTDMAKSVGYYRDMLGFQVTFEYGQPTFYACLCRDEVALHLIASAQTKRLPGNGGI
jgi:catechol 2,3-dioxygenase-like lactoylglutathione lyase family enzyme